MNTKIMLEADRKLFCFHHLKLQILWHGGGGGGGGVKVICALGGRRGGGGLNRSADRLNKYDTHSKFEFNSFNLLLRNLGQ